MYSNLYSFLNIFIYRQQIPISKPTVMPPNSLKMKRYEFSSQNFHIILFFIYNFNYNCNWINNIRFFIYSGIIMEAMARIIVLLMLLTLILLQIARYNIAFTLSLSLIFINPLYTCMSY